MSGNHNGRKGYSYEKQKERKTHCYGSSTTAPGLDFFFDFNDMLFAILDLEKKEGKCVVSIYCDPVE